MDKTEIDALIKQYPIDKLIEPDKEPWSSQYDQRSASINYALVRWLKPMVTVEFGARAGRCTRDIWQAMRDNNKGNKRNGVIKSYELEKDKQLQANKNLKVEFGKYSPRVNGDIMESKNIPDNIDYLFVDNNHDEKTTRWVFNKLLKKVKPGALVHFHDVQVEGDYEFKHNAWGEMHVMEELVKENKFPLKKLYWTYEEGREGSSTWWIHKPKKIYKL